MATWTGPHTHYNNYTTGTLKYDVSEAIWRITPDDTPFYNMSGDTQATAMLHEWMEEELTTRADNAAIEGANWGSLQPPISQERVQNRVQTLKKSVVVTRLMQRVRQWGITDMFGSNMLKRMREWKTDCEHALIRGSGKVTPALSTASRLDGVMWCISAGGNVVDHSGTTFAEADFNDMFQDTWTAGGFPEDVLVGPNMKRRISGFTSAADQSYFNVDNTKVRNTISVYESDFTTVTVHLSRDIQDGGSVNDKTCLLLTSSMFKKAWIDRPFAQRIPPPGDGMYGVILGDLTLECGARAAHGAYINAG